MGEDRDRRGVEGEGELGAYGAAGRFGFRPLSARAAGAAFAVALAGFDVSYSLARLDRFVMDAICQWCVDSALLVTGITHCEGVQVWCVLGAELDASTSND